MKKEKLSVAEEIDEYIESQKAAFRQYQRNLPFGEKMQIAFSLAERDKTIRQARLLSGKKNSSQKV